MPHLNYSSAAHADFPPQRAPSRAQKSETRMSRQSDKFRASLTDRSAKELAAIVASPKYNDRKRKIAAAEIDARAKKPKSNPKPKE